MKAKLLILPSWLEDSLRANGLNVSDIKTTENLKSILTDYEVQNYLKLVDDMINGVNLPYKKEAAKINALEAALYSFDVLFSDSDTLGSRRASGIEQSVKINTLYGNGYSNFDFFVGRNAHQCLDRFLQATTDDKVKVDPVITYSGIDELFVLRFELNKYHRGFNPDSPIPVASVLFMKDTLNNINGNLGFNYIKDTPLFDIYMQSI